MKSINKWTDPKTGKRYVGVESDGRCHAKCDRTQSCAFLNKTLSLRCEKPFDSTRCCQYNRPDNRSIIWREVQPTRKPDAVAVNRLALDLYVTLNTALDMSMGVKTPRRGLAPHVRPAYLALARWVLKRYERKS